MKTWIFVALAWLVLFVIWLLTGISQLTVALTIAESYWQVDGALYAIALACFTLMLLLPFQLMRGRGRILMPGHIAAAGVLISVAYQAAGLLGAGHGTASDALGAGAVIMGILICAASLFWGMFGHLIMFRGKYA